MAPAPLGSGHRAQLVDVDPDFFDALRVPILSGRGFDASDLEFSDLVVVVNEHFVRVVLGGRSPLGRALRYTNPSDPDAETPEYTIVGVVKQIGMSNDPSKPDAPGVYHPLRRARSSQLRLIMRPGGNAASYAPRLRTLAAEVAPSLQLLDVRPVSEAAWDRVLAFKAMFWLMLAAGGMAVLLSTSGIYSIMSFSVSRRTREIGVRVALGASRVQVAWAVLARTARQIAIGVLAGGVLSLGVMYGMLYGTRVQPTMSVLYVGLFGSYLAAMTCVCLLAAMAPTNRALRIEPTDALKVEG